MLNVKNACDNAPKITFPIRHQIKFHAFHCPIQSEGMDCQNYDQCQKAEHHYFGDFLKAALYAQGTNAKR